MVLTLFNLSSSSASDWCSFLWPLLCSCSAFTIGILSLLAAVQSSQSMIVLYKPDREIDCDWKKKSYIWTVKQEKKFLDFSVKERSQNSSVTAAVGLLKTISICFWILSLFMCKLHSLKFSKKGWGKKKNISFSEKEK